MPFFTKPNWEDRQVVQYSGTSITLSGDTNINPTGNFRIKKNAFPGLVATSLDSDGTVVWSPISGISWSISACTSPLYVNNLVSCPLSAGTIQVDAGNFALNSELQFLISLSAGTNNDNILVIDNSGYVKSIPYVNGNNMWYVPNGYTLTIPDNYQSFIYGDLYVLGTLDLQTNAQLVVLNGNIILSGGSIIGSGTTQLVTLGIDNYVTGGTFDNSTGTLTLNRQNGSLSITGFTFNSTPFTGGTGSCITNLYVSNIHSCSPLYINPLNEGNIYFGSASTLTVDLINERVGVGTTTPSQKLEVFGSDALIHDLTVGRGGGSNGNNTVLGSQALSSNTIGVGNIAIGKDSLQLNTAGNSNIGVGLYSLLANKTGSYNIAVGTSQISSTGSTKNISLGDFTLYNNTSNSNIAFGYETLYTNVSGTQNIGIGEASLYYNNTGNNNVGVGISSLFSNTSGDNNLALGAASLSNNDTGTNNVAIGYASAAANVSGNDNIAIGRGADFGAPNLSNAIVIGYTAVVNTSNSMVLGNGVNVGIGTSSPSEKLEVSGKTKTTELQVTSGATAGYVLTAIDSDGNAIWQAPTQFTGNTSASCITDLYVSNIHSCSPLNINPLSEGNVYFGSTSAVTVDLTNNRLGIGTTTPSQKLEVSGGDALIHGVTVGRGGGSSGNNTVLGAAALNSNTTGSGNIAIGRLSLSNNTTTNNNISIGNFSLFSNTGGTYNIALGTNALSSNLMSNTNIAIGYESLYSLISGSGDNIAIGYQSMYDNINGIYNNAIGNYSLRSNTIGNSNTAIGWNSMNDNTTGNANTAVGFSSLNSNTSGGQNVSLGHYSMNSNQTGFQNVAVGSGTLSDLISGYGNTALGFRAMENSTGGNLNIGIGVNSLNKNISGTQNIAIGTESLFSSTGGTYNIAIGGNSLRNNISASNIAIGYDSQREFTGTTGGNVSLGNNSLRNNKSGSYNVAIGDGTLYNNDTGTSNTAVGINALYNNIDGLNNVSIGYNSNYNNQNGFNNLSIGRDSLLNNNGNFNFALGKETLYSNGTGQFNVAIGDSALKYSVNATNNIAIGHIAMQNSPSGSTNIAIGNASLLVNKGGDNISLGQYSLSNNTDGSSNVALGTYSLWNNTTGINNIAIGGAGSVTASLGDNTTGSNNIGIGLYSLNVNKTGDYNIAIGYNSNVISSGLTNAIAIGANTVVGSSNTMVLGNGVNVGIGVSNPTTKLEVSGKTKTTELQVTSGATAGYVLTAIDSDGNAIWQAPTQFTGNTSATCITDLYVTNVHGCSPINIQPTSPDGVHMVMGGGKVGIGTTSPGAKLEIIGDTSGDPDYSLRVQNSSATNTLELSDSGNLYLNGTLQVNGGILSVDNQNTSGKIKPTILQPLNAGVTGTETFYTGQTINAGWVIESIKIYTKTVDSNVVKTSVSTLGGVWTGSTGPLLVFLGTKDYGNIVNMLIPLDSSTPVGVNPHYFSSSDILRIDFYDQFDAPTALTTGDYVLMINYWDGSSLL